MSHKFKNGDRVRIRRTSQYASQSSAVGEILDAELGGWIRVSFEDGTSNHYKDSDLELDKITILETPVDTRSIKSRVDNLLIAIRGGK